MSNNKNQKGQMSNAKINKVNFDGAYLRSSSGHFWMDDHQRFISCKKLHWTNQEDSSLKLWWEGTFWISPANPTFGISQTNPACGNGAGIPLYSWLATACRMAATPGPTVKFRATQFTMSIQNLNSKYKLEILIQFTISIHNLNSIHNPNLKISIHNPNSQFQLTISINNTKFTITAKSFL